MLSKNSLWSLYYLVLYSELESDALKNILHELNKIKFLNHIIIGLDKADQKQYLNAKKFFSILNAKHSILWNDGPRLKKITKYIT